MEKLCPAIFGILTLMLLLAGAFSPGWFVLSLDSISGLEDHPVTKSIKVYLGLFYFLVTGEDSNTGKSFSIVMSYAKAEGLSGTSYLALGMLEFQVEVCIGLVLAILSLIFGWVYNRDKSPSMLLAPAIMYLIAAIATWVAVGRFLTGVFLIASLLNLPTPFSLILSGIGGVFCLILAIIYFVMYCQHNNQHQPQQGVVFTDVAMGNMGQPQPYGQPQYGQDQQKMNYGHGYSQGPPPKA